jgi:hypothetical protein
MKYVIEILKIIGLFIMVIIFLFALWLKSVFAYDLKHVSFPAAMFSIHSNAQSMNENHRPGGFCLGHFCHTEFINSFGDKGTIEYIDGRFTEGWYLSGWKKFWITSGIRFSMMFGYDWEPVPCIIPYFGLGYQGKLPCIVFVNNSTIPALDGSNHYLTVTEVRVEIKL